MRLKLWNAYGRMVELHEGGCTMKRITLFAVLLSVLLLCPKARAEITFGPGLRGALVSGDREAAVEALFGSVLAISPGETLWEHTRLELPWGGPVYLVCPGLPKSLKGLVLTVEGDSLIFEGELGSADWIYLGDFPTDTDQPLTFTLKVPGNLSQEGKRDWQALHWLLTATPPQLPPTGDTAYPEIAALVALGSMAGLAMLLPQNRYRYKNRYDE